jgi:hypothetical protein
MISLVMFLLIEEYNENPDVLDQTGFIVTFVATLVISFAVLGVITYSTIKDSCYVSRLVEWNVGSHKKKKKPEIQSFDSSVTVL